MSDFDDLFAASIPSTAPAPEAVSDAVPWEQAPAPAPSPEPATPSPDVAALQQQIQLQQLRERDAARILTGQPAQPPAPDYGNMHPAQFAEMVRQQAAQEAVQRVQAEQNVQTMINEYKQNYPHLAPFENAIRRDAEQRAYQLAQQGQPVDDRAVIDSTVKDWEKNLQVYNQTIQQRQTQDAMKQNALQFNVSGTGQNPVRSITEALAWAGDDPVRFSKVEQAVKEGKLKLR